MVSKKQFVCFKIAAFASNSKAEREEWQLIFSELRSMMVLFLKQIYNNVGRADTCESLQFVPLA